jgi:hypothetical protein
MPVGTPGAFQGLTSKHTTAAIGSGAVAVTGRVKKN